MSADDAQSVGAHVPEPTAHRETKATVRSSTDTRRTAAYWSMQQTMSDLS